LQERGEFAGLAVGAPERGRGLDQTLGCAGRLIDLVLVLVGDAFAISCPAISL
jgi:hypothetical protein